MGAGFSCKVKAPKAAEILIYEDVGGGFFGGVSSKQFSDELRALGAIDQIDVRINSIGGDVNEGVAIYNRLVEHPARIVAHIDGTAASIASVIAMAGDEIIIAESGSMMVHDAWVIAAGNAAEFAKLIDRLERTSAQMAEIYASRTGKPSSQIRAWMAETKWFYGIEAVAAGMATSVAENMRMAAVDASLWASQMLGRFGGMRPMTAADESRPEQAATPHPANSPERAQLAALNTRMRARHLTSI